MRNSFIIFILLLVINILAGLVFREYEYYKVAFSSFVIICNFFFIMVLQKIVIKDAFKIALSFFLPFIALIELILAVMTPYKLENNYYLMGVVSLLFLQFFVFFIINIVSKKID